MWYIKTAIAGKVVDMVVIAVSIVTAVRMLIMEIVKLHVDGISCGHREIAIQNAVHKLLCIKKN